MNIPETGVALSQSQFDALEAFAYNVKTSKRQKAEQALFLMVEWRWGWTILVWRPSRTANCT